MNKNFEKLINKFRIINAILGDDLGFEIIETEGIENYLWHDYVFYSIPVVKDWLKEQETYRRKDFKEDGIASCLDADGVYSDSNIITALDKILEAYNINEKN